MCRQRYRGKIKYPVICIACIISLLAVCSYTVSYTSYLRQVESRENVLDKDTEEYKNKEHNQANESLNDKHEDESVETALTDVRIDKITKYKIIDVDLVTTRESNQITKAPEYLYGLSRNQLEKYYENYMLNRPVEEVEKGLQTINVLEFSKDEVVVQKVYDASKVRYVIQDKGGVIKVYYNDYRTLYENTGISTLDLPKLERDNLIKGIEVDSREELLSILENYSS